MTQLFYMCKIILQHTTDNEEGEEEDRQRDRQADRQTFIITLLQITIGKHLGPKECNNQRLDCFATFIEKNIFYSCLQTFSSG